MFRILKWVAIPAITIGLFMAADTPKADAGGFSLSIGTGGGFYGAPYSGVRVGYGGYGRGIGVHPGYGIGYGYGRGPVGYSYRSTYRSYAPAYRVPAPRYDVYRSYRRVPRNPYCY
ncbi:MAG: hypothetical protein AAFP69_09925 [Planctomycetota bacterium]